MAEKSGVTVKWEGYDEYTKAMADAAKVLPTNLKNGLKWSLALIETRAKTYHLAGGTLNYRTHRLQKSVKSQIFPVTGNVYGGSVGTPLVYGAIHEYGGKIVPKNAEYLVFQINGRWIRTKSVTIPKRPWLSNSAKDAYPGIRNIMGDSVKLSFP